MLALFKKELSEFFSSITGYVVIVVFLIATSTFMWVIPGQMNVLDSGYANIDTFFFLAPWVFMFLIPAVTMRLFADEKKTGTIELLLTRPISDFTIVLAKYLSALTIVIIAIIPTFVYFISVYYLGSPVGNIDIGGTWGSYIGLFFLTASYASIGVFISSLTDNQIVAFILSLALVFVFFMGFESLSTLFTLNKGEFFLQGLSIDRHYRSMSRGVIDTRDLAYFAGLIAFFIMLTKFKLQSRKW
jgi:ABC-2 type transport system permease protein